MSRLLLIPGASRLQWSPCQRLFTAMVPVAASVTCAVRRSQGKTRTPIRSTSLPAVSWQCVSVPTASVLPAVSVRWFGQPVAHTHPHLLSSGDVTPNISRQEYRERRSRLVNLAHRATKAVPPDTHQVLVFPSACRVYMTNDIPYPFRQNSDFLYLCGFQEPNSILVIESKGKADSAADNHVASLFVRQKDPHQELWEGPCSGKEGTVEITGVDGAYNYSDIEGFLYNLCNQRGGFALWYDFSHPVQDHFHRNVMAPMISQEQHTTVDCTRRLMHQLRVKKSAAEVELMRQSVQIASDAFVDVMRFSRPEVEESHLWAKMDFECRIRGAQFLAYPPVVAGGTRANTIHYTANNQVIADGELVLMDAGCELHGYTSDLTRTWPVNGKFSPAQRALYEATLAVQTACLSLCTTQHSLDDIYRQMLAMLGLQLQALGIVPQDAFASSVIKKARELCPHHVGHYLGMDVHDTEEVSRSVKLEPGMIVTIEPGIYIQKDDSSVDEKFRGIGIRIEDNVLITDTTPVNLSQKCPKTVQDIERIMSETKRL